MAICPEFVPNWTVIILALLLADALGWLFTIGIGKLDTTGYTWLLVVIGVSGTLGISLVMIPWQYVAMLFGFFAFSGAPMAAGDILRTLSRRRKAQDDLRSEARRERDEVLHDG